MGVGVVADREEPGGRVEEEPELHRVDVAVRLFRQRVEPGAEPFGV